MNARNQSVKGETQGQRTARIAKADKDFPSASAELSKLTLAPAAAQLGNKRLVIVSDGALQYIPFAALPEPVRKSGNHNTRPTSLIVRHEVVNLPSASTLAVLRSELKGRKLAAKLLAVVADPVFTAGDERVKVETRGTIIIPPVVNTEQNNAAPESTPAKPIESSADPDIRRQLVQDTLSKSAKESGAANEGLFISRLQGTRREAEQIMAFVPRTESKLALGFAANRAMAVSDELSQYRYIHFATHGFLNSVHPELSGIVLSMVDEKGRAQDGFLRAHEIFNLKLPAELVVLSACETGLGKEVSGEGLVSLTRGFMYAGSPRVIVSLWSVSDESTVDLMTELYRGLLRDGSRPAAALRAAQIRMQKQKQWGSPYYWAAFTLQGEWR